MLKSRKIIFGFALIGLAIAAALYVYALSFNYTKRLTPWDVVVGFVSFIFCPPTLLLAGCIDCEISGWNGVFIFSTVGLLNAALYAVIAAMVLSFRQKSS